MHFVTCSQRQSGNLKRQQPPIIVSTNLKPFQYLKLLLYLLNIIIILFYWINILNVRLLKCIYFAFQSDKTKSQGVSFVFKKIVDIRKIFCALSIILRNKTTSADTHLYPGCQRLFQRGFRYLWYPGQILYKVYVKQREQNVYIKGKLMLSPRLKMYCQLD